ncbi:transglutaminaseTgpA domain-containing protein [Nonomuraea sp. NPDC049158]|uniref:transglutaminaseTgpA domain-containing protein n=1 Tax=Nonomuraea sp. NPDC049158 TaxID=3155649 RepID=UPI0033D1B8BC
MASLTTPPGRPGAPPTPDVRSTPDVRITPGVRTTPDAPPIPVASPTPDVRPMRSGVRPAWGLRGSLRLRGSLGLRDEPPGVRPGAAEAAPLPPVPEWRRVASIVIVILLAGTAGLAFDGVFALNALIPMVTVAAVVPGVVSYALARILPLWASLAVHLLVWLVAVSATLFRAQALAGFLPSPASVRAALLGVRDSGKALLTTILPAEGDGRTIVLAHFLVWAAAVAGAELALRTRAVVLPAAPAVPVLAAAVVLGVSGPGSQLPTPAVLVGLALALALVRAARAARMFVAGVPLLAGLVLVAVAAGPVLPFASKPYDVRQLVAQPPSRPLAGVSPLDQVSAWLQNPYRQLFTVRSTTEANWRLAVLDRFDGVTWTSGAGYLPTGGRVPGEGSAGSLDVVEQQFTLQKLAGPWLPAADRPQQVSLTGPTPDSATSLMADPATGMLASATTTTREGITYRVTSGIRRYSAAELREAVPAADQAALVLPNGPDGRTPPQRARLAAIARKATAGATSPMQQAVRLASYLRKHAEYDVNSPPGHSYRSIQFFLTEAKKGTTEQFAASYALLARSLGLPSRVVVGFGPGKAEGGGVRQVLAGDVLAWAEVEFKGIGWVPFYPTPARSHAGQSGDVAEGVSKQRQEIEQEISGDHADLAATPSPHRPTPQPSPRQAGHGAGTTWLPIAGAVTGGLLGGYLLAVTVLPPLRRRRRRTGDPRARVAGAWRQTLVRLRAAGVPASSRVLTAREVATLGVTALGVHAYEPLTGLADLANLTRFGDAPADQAAADMAWRHYANIDLLVRQKIALPRRLAHRLAPGSLLR